MKSINRVTLFWRSGLRVLAFGCLAAAWLAAQSPFQIISPSSGTTVNPGQPITIKISVAPGVSIENLAIGSELIGLVGVSGPPYQISIQIPARVSLRKYPLTATGLLAGAQRATSIILDVERPDRPMSLRTEPSTLRMSIGSESSLSVVATYVDGSKLYVSESTLTSYVSKRPAIASVNSDGIVTAHAPGTTDIAVTNAGVSALVIPVTVVKPVGVIPDVAKLYPSQMKQFHSSLSDPSFGPVTWSMSPPGLGTISRTGEFEAPDSIRSKLDLTVTATSVKNSEWVGSASVTLSPPLSVSLAPETATLGPSQSRQFTAMVDNDVYYNPRFPQVGWSIKPAIGIIDGNGLYTAPPAISGNLSIVVTATSRTDPSRKASANVNLRGSE